MRSNHHKNQGKTHTLIAIFYKFIIKLYRLNQALDLGMREEFQQCLINRGC